MGIAKGIEASTTVNIVVVGHVDSGKSTLVGIFLK
jgi:translation elongation factor EF-1alpha